MRRSCQGLPSALATTCLTLLPMQNICGIPLPRAADTCTRCPTEVRLSQQPPSNGLLWEATVKLRREHSLGARALFHQTSSNSNSGNNASSMYSPMSAGRQPSHTGGVSSNSGSKAGGSLYPTVPGSPNPSAPLQQQPSQHQVMDQPQELAMGDGHTLETVFKAGIARPEDLPAAVSAAQACLLAGSRPAGDYSKRSALHTTSFGQGAHASPADVNVALRTAEAGQHAGLKFSRDVVIVEVSGAPVDLTLIDLPGECYSRCRTWLGVVMCWTMLGLMLHSMPNVRTCLGGVPTGMTKVYNLMHVLCLCLCAGIIHNVERPEDEHYKVLVTDLAERYMRRPGVVIVATITCTADIDTQVRHTPAQHSSECHSNARIAVQLSVIDSRQVLRRSRECPHLLAPAEHMKQA